MKKLWILLIAVFVFSFAILGWVGTEIFRQAPPIPREVVTTDGQVLIADGADHRTARTSGRRWAGCRSVRSGDTARYVAPDWTADYLHREVVVHPERMVGRPNLARRLRRMPSEQQAVLRQRLQDLMRTNTYDEATGTLTVDPVRAAGVRGQSQALLRDFHERQQGICDPARMRSPIRQSCGS